MPYCIITEMSSPVEKRDDRRGGNRRDSRRDSRRDDRRDDRRRPDEDRVSNPVAPYARFAIATTPSPNAPCP